MHQRSLGDTSVTPAGPCAKKNQRSATVSVARARTTCGKSTLSFIGPCWAKVITLAAEEGEVKGGSILSPVLHFLELLCV